MADRALERIVLHIGTHKTGSTSLQRFLRDEAERALAAAGVAYPPGFLLADAHSELPLLSVRSDRRWPARIRLPETQRPEWLAAAEKHVRRQVATTTSPVLVFSHEDLSYLRWDDELERLRDLLGGPAVEVVVFLRNAADFLTSYREQLTAMGFDLSEDRESFAYVEPDSWLVDRDALLAGYRRWFGAEQVHVVDYDEVMRLEGSVIPAFTRRLGIPAASLPPLDGYFLNRGGSQVRLTDAQLASARQRIIDQAP